MSDALTNTNPQRIMQLAAIGACVVLGAMGLLTWQALRLERREQSAQAQAQFQESLRLALWRIDSAMTPIIAREAARPYFEYQPFYPTTPPSPGPEEKTKVAAPGAQPEPTPSDPSERRAGEVLVPSPLLASTDEFVNLHFQMDSEGGLSSPQVPQGKLREIAEAGYVTPYAITHTEDKLGELLKLTGGGARNAGQLWTQQPGVEQPVISPRNDAADDRAAANTTPPHMEQQPKLKEDTQRQLAADGDNEYVARRDALNKATSQYNQQAEELARGQQRGMASKDGKFRSAKDDGTAREQAKAESQPADKETQPAQANQGKDEGPAGAATGSPSPAATPGASASPLTQAQSTTVHAVADDGVATTGSPATDADMTAWPPGELIVQGQFMPQWLPPAGANAEPELIFIRSVRVGDRTLKQGFWLDWSRLRTTLLEPVKPLFPACTIRPVGAVTNNASQSLGRMLATIPAELVVDAPAATLGSSPRWTPLRGVLVVVWALVIGSVIAMFGIVRASIELAERRGRFVSAVTHELRTPLTTFCLYSQMLSDGMVPTEDAKRQYARTLHHESIRLTRIVESVLDFARLGRGSRAAFETLTLRELRARIEPGLLAACDRAEMRLDVSLTCDADQPVRTDPAILERVLGNLVDNACKYARNTDNPEQNHIVLTWSIENGRLRASVRDFGPGVPPEDQARVFDAFVRGRAHAHGSTPGLGLGLALSRGLAEQLGGELRMTQASPGVEFVLDIAAA